MWRRRFFVPLDKLLVFVVDIFQRLEGMMTSLYHSFIFEEAEEDMKVHVVSI